MRHLSLASITALAMTLCAQPAASQSSIIIADEGDQRGTGTLVDQQGDLTIIDGGAFNGGNLFHSFSQFDLAQGETAQWTFSFGDPASIDNVINRVTGSAPSTINGTVDSTAIPNADFFFINPAGVIFGENALVNVPAAAHFSTASHVAFADGARFSAVTPEGSTFTMAPPSTFGFLGNEGVLQVFGNAQRPELTNGGPLALSASSIDIAGRSLSADLLAISATGTSAIEVPPSFANAEAALGNGEIAVRNTSLSTLGSDGIGLAAGKIIIADQSLVLSETVEEAGAPLLLVGGTISLTGGSALATSTIGSGEGGLILVDAAQALTIDGASVATATASAGNAGNILLRGPDVDLRSADIRTQSGGVDIAVEIATGGSGSIEISALDLRIADQSFLQNNSFGAGSLGTIGLFAPAIEIENSLIGQRNFGDRGLGGIVISGADIVIGGGARIITDSFETAEAGTISLQGETITVGSSLIASDTFGAGNSGAILITASDITLLEGTQVASATFDTGNGSLILVSTERFSAQNSEFLLESFNEGNSGAVNITAATIVTDFTSFTSNAQGLGEGGLIFLTAEDEILLRDSTLASDALGEGPAGFIRLQAPVVEGNRLLVTAGTSGTASAGNFDVIADSLRLIDSDLFFPSFGDGAVGAFRFTAGDVILADTFFLTDAFGAGEGGLNSIVADTITITDNTIFSLSSRGSGDGGVFQLVANEVNISQGASFLSSASGGGDAGAVFINAQAVRIANAAVQLGTQASGNAGFFIVEAPEISLTDTNIFSETSGTGIGGTVRLLDAEAIDISGVTIATSALSSGDAGVIEIFGRDISIRDTQLTSLGQGLGNAGFININGDTIDVDSAVFTTEAVLAGSGLITLDAARITINDTVIDSTIAGDGDSGQIGLFGSESLELRSSDLASDSTGPSNGGDIVLSGPSILVSDTDISSNAVNLGSGGRLIFASEGGSVDIVGGSIISSSAAGPADAGFIFLAADDVSIEDSSLSTITAGAGNAGTIQIIAETVGLSGAQVRSSTFPLEPEFGPFTGNAGSIGIFAGEVDLFGSEIESSTNALGRAGSVTITADALSLTGSDVSTAASLAASGAAGAIDITLTGALALTDQSSISSSNEGSNTGIDSSGTISIAAGMVEIAGSSQITTNSVAGPAGDIRIELPSQGTIALREGGFGPSIITTSSGPGTGGVITIAEPLAIISEGGEIRALGEQGGANVLLATPFFIDAADTLDAVLVDGTLTFEGNLDYFVAGEEAQEINPLDAGAVLSGRCRSARSSGVASQFSASPTGPFAEPQGQSTEPAPSGPASDQPAETVGADTCR